MHSVWHRVPTPCLMMMLLEVVYHLLGLVESIIPRLILIGILHFRRIPCITIITAIVKVPPWIYTSLWRVEEGVVGLR